jgi:hypothetical protein
MAETITVSPQETDYAIGVSLSGLTVGRGYRLDRKSSYETKPVRQWKALSPSGDWLDVLAPFGENVVYQLVRTDTGAVVATSASVLLPWSPETGGDVPLFTVEEGAWPVLRAADKPGLPAVRVPVADYTADFGFRTTTMPILGSYWPVVATQPMQAKRFTMVLLTPDTATRRDMMRLFRDGYTFHLRSPCVDGLGDVFFKVLDITESAPLRARPLLRQWQVEAQQIARPVGYDVLEWAVGRKWADVETLGRWSNVKAQGKWRDVKLPNTVDAYTTRPLSGGGDW